MTSLRNLISAQSRSLITALVFIRFEFTELLTNPKTLKLQGAVEGPGEFAEGLAIGVRSVFSGVVGGAAGTVSKITGALGKGREY